MTNITVKEVNQQSFEVIVEANTTTSHEVNIDVTYAKKLTNSVIHRQLIEQSFAFLSAHDANASILRNLIHQ